MAKLPKAKLSPRLENGVLYWYAGDTFRLHLLLQLETVQGEPVSLEATHSLKLSFYDSRQNPVKTVTWSGSDVVGDTVTLTVDQQVSALFPQGKYHYNLQLLGEEQTTLVRSGKVIVE